MLGKHPIGEASIEELPDIKKRKIEQDELQNREALFTLEELPTEIQHQIFSFLFYKDGYPLLSDLANRNVVTISRVSKVMRSSVFSFFISQRQVLIKPTIRSLKRIECNGVFSVASRIEGSLLGLKGLKANRIKHVSSENIDLDYLYLPSPKRIDGLKSLTNKSWDINDDNEDLCESEIAVNKHLLSYFKIQTSSEFNSSLAVFFLNYFDINMDDARLAFFLEKACDYNCLETVINLATNQRRIKKMAMGLLMGQIVHSDEGSKKWNEWKEANPSYLLGEFSENIALIAAGCGQVAVLDWLESQSDERFMGLLASHDAKGRNIAHISAYKCVRLAGKT